MKELLEVIAKNLVDAPEKVEVIETQKDRTLILELKVDPKDMGKVIGKQGRIAKAIRTVVKASGVHEDKKIIVEIIQ
ncbi:MAG: KH domain-containing protein [Bacillota bacterium]